MLPGVADAEAAQQPAAEVGQRDEDRQQHEQARAAAARGGARRGVAQAQRAPGQQDGRQADHGADQQHGGQRRQAGEAELAPLPRARARRRSSSGVAAAPRAACGPARGRGRGRGPGRDGARPARRSGAPRWGGQRLRVGLGPGVRLGLRVGCGSGSGSGVGPRLAASDAGLRLGTRVGTSGSISGPASGARGRPWVLRTSISGRGPRLGRRSAGTSGSISGGRPVPRARDGRDLGRRPDHLGSGAGESGTSVRSPWLGSGGARTSGSDPPGAALLAAEAEGRELQGGLVRRVLVSHAAKCATTGASARTRRGTSDGPERRSSTMRAFPQGRTGPDPRRGSGPCDVLRHHMVGLTGFEPAASSSRTRRATKLRHSPIRSATDERRRSTASIPERSEPSEIGLDGERRRGSGRRAGPSVSRVASGRQATRKRT